MQRKRPVNTQTKEQLDKRMDNISKMSWGDEQSHSGGGQMLPDTNNRPNGQQRIKPVTSAKVAQQIAARVKSGEKIEHDYQWGEDIKKGLKERNQELKDKHSVSLDDYDDYLAWKKNKEAAEKQEPLPDPPGTSKNLDDNDKFSVHAKRMIREGNISQCDADDLYVHLGRKVMKADLDGII